MTPNDMIYDSIYKGCKKIGCCELTSKNAAIMGLQKYKNHQFVKPSKLITEAITEAKRLMVKKRKK